MNAREFRQPMAILDPRDGPRRSFLALIVALHLVCAPVQAQQASRTAPATDLAAQNENRVAASAMQIRVVLEKEPGLMLELKRWVAKEATDRGQIVEDADLSDAAIFDRLSRDTEFRAVATRLLQRYSYLIPAVNPDSERGKENELARQERAQRLARARARADADEAGEFPDERREALPQRTASRERPSLREDVENPPRAPDLRRDRVSLAAVPEGAATLPSSEALPARPGERNPLEDPEIRSRLLVQTGLQVDADASRPGDVSRAGSAALEKSLSLATSAPEAAAADRRRGELIREPGAGPTGQPGRAPAERPAPAEVALVSRTNPFADIPSLYEMYRQVSPRPIAITRFGEDVFRNAPLDGDVLPMDLPVGPDYVVGPGDGLAIDLWGGVSQRLFRTVDREGRLALPEVGPLLVSGRTLGEVQQAVQQILRTQFRDVSADVSLSRLRTIRVYVVGDAERPGPYDISSLSTPLNALFVAGGPTPRGSLRTLRHYRGSRLVQEVDVYDLLLRGVRSDLKRLENGDTVLVPPMGPQATVDGAVRRPAIYELKAEQNLAEVLALAGGILPTAALRQIQVQRVEAHQKRTMLSVDVAEGLDREAVANRLESFPIRDGDEVRIFPIAPYNPDAVYLQGHVVRPGRYSYRQGMKLTDLVSSYGDLLPEPAAKYAEIVRLNLPDYRPSVESVDLAAALASPATAPELKPMDTVRIFSRYDFENVPTVLVGGEVRHPGVYQTSGQVHLRDAIHLAGGVTPDALFENAQVFRYLPDSKLKITSVNLREALEGNPLDNILLQPRDRILIHRNPAKVDPPSVFAKGEVAKPGRYPLTTNLRVADLIRLAGGLKRSAFPEKADLTRFLPESGSQAAGEHREVDIAAALADDPQANLLLRDGDTLSIRQLPGWNDIGASVTIYGEARHPGVYGIQPGERLSSVLHRVGGFLDTAYPQGALLERLEVREIQERSKQDLIRRIEQDAANVRVTLEANPQEQAALQQASLQQRERVIQFLRNTPVTGRLVVRLHRDVAKFANSPYDVELRAGDRIFIPKRPDFVLVTGQVYNANAVTYVARKNAGWYLTRAGGATDLADKGATFIIRANGEVISGNTGGWWSGGVLSHRVEPGDVIVVPEKPIGGSSFWRNFLSIAQLIQGGAIAAAVVTR